MGRRQHVKSRDPSVQRILALQKKTSGRKPMPRPTVFKDRSKYDRKRLPKPGDGE